LRAACDRVVPDLSAALSLDDFNVVAYDTRHLDLGDVGASSRAKRLCLECIELGVYACQSGSTRS
jgi:hypothetical protein